MKSCNFGSTGSMTLIKDNWQEQAAYLWCMEQENKAAAGMQIVQMESVDLEDAEAAMDGMSTYLRTWLTDNVDAAAAGEEITPFDTDYLPELLTFITLAVTGQWGLIFVLFVKVGIKFLVDYFEKRLDPDTDMEGVNEGLENVIKQIFAVLDPETGEIVGSRVEGLTNLHVTVRNIDQSEEDTTYSIE
jgi:hypothetical protein